MKRIALALLGVSLLFGGSGCCCRQWFGSSYAPATTYSPIVESPPVVTQPVVTAPAYPPCCVPCCPPATTTTAPIIQ